MQEEQLRKSYRYLNDFECLGRDYLSKLERELERTIVPIAETAAPNFYIAVASDYAYLLSLDYNSEQYLSNLPKSLVLMTHLQKESSKTNNIYWGYVRNYILGHIYYKIGTISDPNDKDRLIDNSLVYLNRSLNELPDQAKHLRSMVKQKIELCNKEIYLLNQNKLE